jgi:hypothetical protein
MCASLTYEDGTAALQEGRFYTLDEVAGDRDGLEPGESYYFYGLATLEEMAGSWQVVDYASEPSPLGMDTFNATTYRSGDTVIIAFRGTDENLEWLDNVVCYGFANYHSEEAQARAYAKKIASDPRFQNCKFYITGHSLGGYLAQVATAELVQSGLSGNLERTAYFNGIGMAFNSLLSVLKYKDMSSLYSFSHSSLFFTNGKLISYAIKGDWVHNLGTQVGDNIEYYAADVCVQHHLSICNDTYQGLSLWESYLAYAKSAAVTGAGLAIATVCASPSTVTYYIHYGIPDFVRFTWATHETDSFFAYLTQGTRTPDALA